MISASGDLVGAVLSRRFRLTKKLGQGGMGAVYAAEKVDDHRLVAIKIVHPEWLGEASVLARFMEEGRTAQRLVHPNMLRVFETAEAEDGSPYLVMELLEGVPLSAYTANGGRIPPAQAVPIVQGVLAGLATAHAQGVVHRDLKPDNVFLARDAGGKYAVKVLDFGIAKVMDAAGGMGARTKTGVLLGTPAYMSPEQVKNAKDVDARADLWSAGVMLYEMLTGRVAFPAPTEYARLSAILTSTPDPVERVDPQLASFSQVFVKALAKDRDLRYASALEMARALAQAYAAFEGASTSDSTLPGSGLPVLPAGADLQSLRGGAGPPVRAASAPDAQSFHSPGAEPSNLPRVAFATPLPRLPDVPSVFAPSVLSPSPAAQPSESLVPITAPAKPPGGTLASPATPTPMAVRSSQAPMAPDVVVISPGSGARPGSVPGGTLPSNDLPMLAARVEPRRKGSRIVVVVLVLVAVALAAGFLAGYGFAQVR